MKNLIILVLITVAGLVFADYSSPKKDTYQTLGLWDFEGSRTLSDGKVIVEDQDYAPTTLDREDRHLTMNDGDSANGWGFTPVSSMSGFGKAVELDGVNDSIRSFVPFEAIQNFEFEVWVNVTPKAGNVWIADMPGVWWLVMDTDCTRINFDIWASDGTSHRIRKAINPAVGWQHIKVGYVNGTAYMDILGGQNGTLDINKTIQRLNWNLYMRIGARDNNTGFFDGIMDDIRWSNPTAPAPPVDYAAVHTDTVRGTFGLYHFDEMISGVIEDDNTNESRFDNDLIAYGDPEVATDGTYPNDDLSFGNSISLNGVSDFLSGGSVESLDLGNFRFETWVKMDHGSLPESMPGGLFFIGMQYPFRLYVENNATRGRVLKWIIWDSNGNPSILTVPSGPLTDWTHLAGDFYNGTAKIFINGVERIAMPLATAAADVVRDPLRVGTFDLQSRFFWGRIDEMRISSAVMPGPQCGDNGYLEADINLDCYVDIDDLRIMASDWLKCTLNNSGCEIEF